MSFLASISLTSGRTLAAVVVLTALSLVTGPTWLPRYAPSRFPRPKRHWFARTVVVLVPILLVASAGALIANRSLGIVKTSGDLGKLIQSSVVGSEAQSGGEVTIGNQSIDPPPSTRPSRAPTTACSPLWTSFRSTMRELCPSLTPIIISSATCLAHNSTANTEKS